MSRSEILLKEREKIMAQLSSDNPNRAKLLVALMDIDEEIEEIRRSEYTLSDEKAV